MEHNTNFTNEDEIDLLELLMALLNKWYLIAVAGLVCALAGMLFTMFLIPEKFESKTSIYIYNQQTDNMTMSDLQTGSTLTKDFEILVKGRNVLENVIEKLNLDLTYGQLNGMVSVTVPANTRIVEITVKTTDPYLSRDIADAVREISSKSIAEVMGVDAVNVVEKANLPEGKSSPSISKNTVLSGLVGVVLACGIIVLLTLLNDTICTPDDVEKYLELSTLGVIPMDEALAADEKKRKKTKKATGRTVLPKRANAKA